MVVQIGVNFAANGTVADASGAGGYCNKFILHRIEALDKLSIPLPYGAGGAAQTSGATFCILG